MDRSPVFLTGATGFLGGHVLRSLLDAGYAVRALVRDRAARVEGAAAVLGDLRRPGELVRGMDGCRVLIHCAAVYSFAPRDRGALRTVNVAGTAGLLEAARVAGIERAVVTGSADAVTPELVPSGAGRAHGMREPADAFVSAYHRSKMAQQRAAVAARVPAVLVLPSAIVGPGDRRPTPTGRMVLEFARGRMFAAPPPGGLNLVPVEDAARAHVLALERGRPREQYLVGGENLALDAVWTMLAEVTGRPAPRRHIPYALALGIGYADELRCRLAPGAIPWVPLEGVRMAARPMYVDDAKARAELGYRSGSVREALARAAEWYAQQGCLGSAA